ncbi:uncharacterized protein [Haliotis asinina]|uniref:uncharacterized protein n=1 Tax=Haliotis asinina TaxID=109174 RepID=UPI00353273A6
MATRWKAAVLTLCALYCETFCGVAAVHRDGTIVTKLNILEEEITEIRNRIYRSDLKRKTDLQIFRNDLIAHLERAVPDVMSRVIEDMAKAGTIQGLVEGTVHTKVKSVEQQLQQLKTLAVNSIKTKPPVPAKMLESKKDSRTFGKRFKRYDKIIRKLKAENDNQKVVINELQSTLTEQRLMLEMLKMDVEKLTSGRTNKTGSETMTSHNRHTTVSPTTMKESGQSSLTVVMAKKGSTAILPCSFTSQTDSYRMWSHRSISLFTWNRINGRTVERTGNSRLSIDRSYSSEWNLVIRDTRQSDGGPYLCSNSDGDGVAVSLIVK